MKIILRILTLCALSLSVIITSNANAAKKPEGLGLVALNLMEPVGLFSDFVDMGCFVIGAGFLFACIIKYIEHRRSPLMTPISTVVFLLIAGIILILLPFLSYVTGNGVPFSLMK